MITKNIPFLYLILTVATISGFAGDIADAAQSEIKNHNYICIHTKKPEALVFKTSSPQKIWRTTLTSEGKIKTQKAYEFKVTHINSEKINKDNEVASFKANIAKDYELKGLFTKKGEGDLPLVVISTYTPDKDQTKRTDNYNCEAEQVDERFKLGSILKD